MSNSEVQALHSAEFWAESFSRDVDGLRKSLRRITELQGDPSHAAPRFLSQWERYALEDCGRAIASAAAAHVHLSFILNAER